MIDGWGISCELALKWMSLDFTDDQSTLVQVMALCRQATSHYLSQCWPRSMSPNGIIRPQWVSSSPMDKMKGYFCHSGWHWCDRIRAINSRGHLFWELFPVIPANLRWSLIVVELLLETIIFASICSLNSIPVVYFIGYGIDFRSVIFEHILLTKFLNSYEITRWWMPPWW